MVTIPVFMSFERGTGRVLEARYAQLPNEVITGLAPILVAAVDESDRKKRLAALRNEKSEKEATPA